jgi:hypothetical protein
MSFFSVFIKLQNLLSALFLLRKVNFGIPIESSDNKNDILRVELGRHLLGDYAYSSKGIGNYFIQKTSFPCNDALELIVYLFGFDHTYGDEKQNSETFIRDYLNFKELNYFMLQLSIAVQYNKKW